MSNSPDGSELDSINHIAISVKNVAESVAWYRANFRCEVEYEDETWAFLRFSNIQLALVIPNQHPPHIAFVSPSAHDHGPLRTHRDGTRSVYIRDPSRNSVEIMDAGSLEK